MNKGCFGNSEAFLKCIVVAYNKSELFETFGYYCTFLVLNNYKVSDL